MNVSEKVLKVVGLFFVIVLVTAWVLDWSEVLQVTYLFQFLACVGAVSLLVGLYVLAHDKKHCKVCDAVLAATIKGAVQKKHCAQCGVTMQSPKSR